MERTKRAAEHDPGLAPHSKSNAAAQTHENSSGTTAGDGPKVKGLSQGRVMRAKVARDGISRQGLSYRRAGVARFKLLEGLAVKRFNELQQSYDQGSRYAFHSWFHNSDIG